ncbi:hypothetical protein GF371_02535 [Candidatus Woesearchaeota archaeon]|nr:hypothetical protein [Candidatus Woesearchaeota archaeon]
MEEDFYGLDTTCTDGITPEERDAYANYINRLQAIVRTGKRIGGAQGLSEEEAKILNKFCDGDVRMLDRFFAAHRRECPYCDSRLKRAIDVAEKCFDADKGLALRLQGDLFIEDGIDFKEFQKLARRVRNAREKVEEEHAGRANEFIDYYQKWADGKVDPKDTSLEHLGFRNHLCGCETCIEYFNALCNMKDYKLG